MRYYETLYILNPNFEQEHIDNIIKDIGTSVGKFANVINHRVWGKKRLAYTIDQHKYGTYILVQFETEKSSELRNYDNYMKLNNSVIRYQTIRLEQKPEARENDYMEESDNVDKTDSSLKKDVPDGENTTEESSTVIVNDETQEENNESEKEQAPESVAEETS